MAVLRLEAILLACLEVAQAGTSPVPVGHLQHTAHLYSIPGTSTWLHNARTWLCPCLQKGVVDTQLIAHDKAVYDIAWGGVGVFASVSADGSVRVFDLR